MVINTDKKIIFIHMPKNAGTSISKLLIHKYGFIRNSKHSMSKLTHEILGDVKWKEYKKFAVVRNPYDRMVSWYFYNYNLEDAKNIYHFRKLYPTFESFILNCEDMPHRKPNRDFFYFKTNQYNCLLDLNNEFIMDYIVYYENLQNDFNKVANILLGEGDFNLKVENKTEKRECDYMKLYNKKMLKRMRELFKEDFIYFDYEVI